MIDIKSLRQQKADLVKKNSSLLGAAETANRDLTAAENAEFEGNKSSIASLNTRIARAEAQLDEERNAPQSAVVEAGRNRAEDKPWRGMGEQLVTLAKSTMLIQAGRGAIADPRILAALGSSETVPSDGGFLVEPEYSADLMKKIYDTGEIAKRCKDFKMNSARTVIPVVDEDSRQDGSRWGGILSYWLAEAQTYTGTKPKFREAQLVANKLIALIYATEELLEDTSLLESYVDEIVPQELSFQTDTAILNGSGSGQPLGILNSPATIQQAIVSAETSISAADILAMWSRAFAPYRKNAVWFINQALEPALYPLQVGSPSLGQYLIYTPPGMNGNTSGTALMMGRPVIPIEQASSPGVVGDITLFCPDGYLLARRNEVRADSSIHVAFLTGEKAFRFMLRLDGQPWWRKPLQPYYPTGGTAPPTLASFITLGARSAD